MTISEIRANFARTLATWKEAVDSYNDTDFALAPAAGSWSAGQVCQHLIGSTRRIFVVIRKCQSGPANEHEVKTEAGERAFATNILSETKVKMPLAVQATPEQPESRAWVKKEFKEIEENFNHLCDLVSQSISTGKEKHPVLGYLNAGEWLQSVEMHFRHHLKQKEEIDAFLRQQAGGVTRV